MSGPHTHLPHSHSLPNVIIDPRVKPDTMYFVEQSESTSGPSPDNSVGHDRPEALGRDGHKGHDVVEDWGDTGRTWCLDCDEVVREKETT